MSFLNTVFTSALLGNSSSSSNAEEDKKGHKKPHIPMWREHLEHILTEETRDFWVDFEVPRLEDNATSTFAREGHSRYHPVVIPSMLDNWPASYRWNKQYLIDKLKDKKISVNLTPDGMADSVQHVVIDEGGVEVEGEYFVYPAEVEMTMAEFFELLERKENDPHAIIPYLSQQNDNLRQQFPELLNDIWTEVGIAEDVFGTKTPEAINLWIGDERSVSSIHKDHFENFYFVVSGAKTFTLLPPTDVAFLPEYTYKTVRYTAKKEEGSGEYELQLTREGVPADSLTWIPLDPNDHDVIEKFPRFENAHPIQVTVYAGETLYIPAMWYHRVSQTELTMSVNFWYDQRFDFR